MARKRIKLRRKTMIRIQLIVTSWKISRLTGKSRRFKSSRRSIQMVLTRSQNHHLATVNLHLQRNCMKNFLSNQEPMYSAKTLFARLKEKAKILWRILIRHLAQLLPTGCQARRVWDLKVPVLIMFSRSKRARKSTRRRWRLKLATWLLTSINQFTKSTKTTMKIKLFLNNSEKRVLKENHQMMQECFWRTSPRQRLTMKGMRLSCHSIFRVDLSTLEM